MIGILKIELPNDFEKGTKGCPLCHRLTCPINDKICSLKNCPLEIQGECETCKNIATSACADCIAGKMNYYERVECPIELKVGNNQ